MSQKVKCVKCSKCNLIQFAPLDKAYFAIFGICWSCDKKEWEQGRLSLKVFEKREHAALQRSIS